ncbi:uncharacterized protein [Nicotiana tomentosiformis]|uniref:uncharacterized protein n=1 Tax=Nicotiana tomentosiformis TaxID=4098 RepID=UPI00388C3F8D
MQKVKGIADKLVALQHPVTNDDLVEFVLAGLGLAYLPFTKSLESRQHDISFDALYRLLLNEERQLKRDESINVIAPIAQFTQSLIPTTRGHGGHGGRGRGRFSNQGFSQFPLNCNFHNFTQRISFNAQSQVSDMSRIISHNCKRKGHIARVRPSPKTNNNSNNVSG